MAKRMKKVFGSSDQVLHLWANQSQSEARCANVFFEGDTCYSYGKHYKLGQIVTYKGKRVALINNTGYSVTTSKHISQACSASRHLIQVMVGREFDIPKALASQKTDIESEMQAHFKRLKFGKGAAWNGEYNYLKESTDKHNELCKTLALSKYKVKVTAKYIRDYDAHIQARLKRDAELNTPEAIAKREAATERRKANANAKAMVKAYKEIAAWRDDSGYATNAVRSLDPQILRVIGDTVETSRGASVPLTEAKALLSRVLRSEAKSGDKVGSFALDKVQGNIVKIGCHNISIEEAKSVLMKLSLVKAS